MKEYLTVKEFAAEAGINFQTVYRQLDGRLAAYVQIIEGKKMIKREALETFYGVDPEKKPDEGQRLVIEAMKRQCALLNKQLNNKAVKAGDLSGTIGNLNNLLNTLEAMGD